MAEANGTLRWVSVVIGLWLVSGMVAVAVWDVWVVHGLGERYTVSAVVGDWLRRYPIATLLVGLILGHLLWPRQ